MHMALTFKIQTIVDELDIKVEEDLSEQQRHFHVSKAFRCQPIVLARYGITWSTTYFRPMQARGTVENGWLASLMSPFCRCSQRSGLNSYGSAKYFGLCETVQTLVYVSVYNTLSVVMIKDFVAGLIILTPRGTHISSTGAPGDTLGSP